jgi:glycosyltransferase involved in cell wall biosynthesis
MSSTHPHPYSSAPAISFWSRAVASNWDPVALIEADGFLLRRGDQVVSAGSCFASNIVPYLEQAGFSYLRTEQPHPAFQDLEPEPLGYAKFSAAYGNIYTVRQLLQLLKRSQQLFSPIEDRWVVGDELVDPLRPGLRYRARSHREFDVLTALHLQKTREAFEAADVFVFTLGLTEAWVSRRDGTVFPACPGTVAGTFDPEHHEFKNFTVAEIVADLDEFITLLRRHNPSVRIILTVSPVPLVATASGGHVLPSTVYSKSVLRAATGEVAKSHPDVTYFPAYEIVTGPQAPEDFFEADRRSVSQAGIETVMSAMLAHCEAEQAPPTPATGTPAASSSTVASDISRLIAEAECEEAMADPRLGRLSPAALEPEISVEPEPPQPREAEAPVTERELIAREFDAAFYASSNSDVSAAADPIQHYIETGWHELRDPAPWFSTKFYLDRHPDIREAGANPFHHYLRHGRAEGREIRKAADQPLVSVIVPNYNHAAFLEERLESILRQSYGRIEILVLDDASTDHSRAVIDRYAEQYPDKFRTVYNAVNSGSVFSQWQRGLEAVRGELVWVCESDDSCDPNFLLRLVPYFIDHSVTLAFGRVQFIDHAGVVSYGLDAYRESAGPGLWDEPRIAPAYEWFRGAFAVRNVIPNVGGCIFRRQLFAPHIWEEAIDYKVLGDWFLYAQIAGGGRIAYEPRAVSYFRQHDGNTSVGNFTTDRFYVEHLRLAKALRRRFGTPDEVVGKFINALSNVYADVFGPERRHELSVLVDTDEIVQTPHTHKHILVAVYGLITGGAEVFAIHLANQLSRSGHTVSMLCVVPGEPENPEVRRLLDPSIAVYDRDFVDVLGPEDFLRAIGVDLVHSHTIEAEYLFLARNGGGLAVPYVTTLHGAYELYEEAGKSVGDADLLAFLRGVDCWIYLTPKNLSHLKGLPVDQDRLVSLPNALPIEEGAFPYSREDIGAGPDDVIFGIASRAIKEKGWEEAIEALHLAQRATSRRLILLFCGDNGPELGRLAPLHRDDPNIRFFGFQPNIHGFYRLCDCCVLPTRYTGESFPLTLVQALQVGTPAIATDVGEIRSMLEQPGRSAGILLRPTPDREPFVKALAAAMLEMSDDTFRSMRGQDAAATGRSYDLTNLADRYVSIYAKAGNWRWSAGAGTPALSGITGSDRLPSVPPLREGLWHWAHKLIRPA